MTVELRLGRYQDVLADVGADAVIVDPPFSQRTHEGARNTDENGNGGDDAVIEYAHWTAADVDELVASWAPRTRRWIVALTDDILAPAYRAAYERAGWYAFHPVPVLTRGGGARMQGDGPASWAIYAMAARPRTREAATWRSLPGFYIGPRGSDASGGRGKAAWLMSALVRDYSERGDLVVDPCAGWGSTLAASEGSGRRAIGAEVDAEVWSEARRRLGRPLQMDMTAMGAM